MGKKTRKKPTTKPPNNITAASQSQLPDDVQVMNPDGSKALFQTNENFFIGGRTVHIGHAAMPYNAGPFAFGQRIISRTGMGERQLMNVQAMSGAFHQKYRDTEIDPMTEAALSLEVKVDRNMHNKRSDEVSVDRNQINESMIMSTHRWIITVLSSDVVRQVSDIAIMYRNVVRTYDPVLEIPLPNPQLWFGTEKMNLVTEENRPEVICLMDKLLKEPLGINVYIYSETNKEILLVIKEFERSEKGLLNLPMDASCSDILEYIYNQAGCIDSACCFWCEKNKLNTVKLSLCTQCKIVSYCSTTCQKRDWRAYHKEECAKLSGKGGGRKWTRDELGLKDTRSNDLNKAGHAAPKLPMEIADINDAHIFRGDILACYITNVNSENPVLTEKTKFFPYGLHIMMREIYHS